MDTLDLSSLRALDKADLTIKHPVTGDPTSWVWTIAGPGHPQTVAFAEKVQRQNLSEARQKEQARVNGKKWKAEDKDPDEVRRENVAGIAARVIGFTPAKIDNEDLTFSPENVMKVLIDPAYGWVFGQVLEFLVDDAAFFPKPLAT